MTEASNMSIASIQATLEAHAEVACRLNRQYELTSPAPVGVNAAGALEHRDLRRLVVLASEPLLRRLFRSMTRTELQELQSKLDDEEGLYTEYELLGSQNYLRDLYNRAPTVAPTVASSPPPLTAAPTAAAARVYDAAAWSTRRRMEKQFVEVLTSLKFHA